MGEKGEGVSEINRRSYERLFGRDKRKAYFAHNVTDTFFIFLSETLKSVCFLH